jgi:hypothetical protein
VSTMTKVFVVLTCVVAIVLSSLTVATAARWSNLRDTLETYQQLAESETVRRMNVEATMATSLAMKDDELRQTRQIVAQKDGRIRELVDDLSSVRTELARRTNEVVAAESGRKKLEEIADVQNAELVNYRKQNQTLQEQNIDLQTRNQRLASRTLELSSELTIATDENRNLREKLYAAEKRAGDLEERLASGGPRRAPASEAPLGAEPVRAPVAGPIAGEVMQVDGTYVSINVGETSGVIAGMDFMVYRGGVYVGDLRVEQVRPKEAGGRLVMVAEGQTVQPGDRVAYGL